MSASTSRKPSTTTAAATPTTSTRYVAPVASLLPPGSTVRAQYPSDLSLKLVQIVHRHGERTPIVPGLSHLVNPVYENCHLGAFLALNSALSTSANARQYTKVLHDADLPQHGATPGTCAAGMLTDQGRTTMTSLGRAARSLYIDALQFLPSKLQEPGDVYLRSSDFARTLESLHSVVEGMYPETDRGGAHPPMHIFTRTPVGSDNIYRDFGCERYRRLAKQFNALIKHEVGEDMKSWSAKLQDMASDPKHGAVLAFDILGAALAHGRATDVVTPAEYETLRDASTRLWFGHMVKYPEMGRLLIGRFVTEVHELMAHHVTGVAPDPAEFSMHVQHMRASGTTNPPRLALYSGHDTTLVPLVAALGAWDHTWPPFASHLTLELFQTETRAEDSHFVRLRLNGTNLRVPACQEPGAHYPGDPSLCTYAAFKALVDQVGTTRAQRDRLCVPLPVASTLETGF
ncbi:hypothetical protein GGF32_002642 [Allomyces javanicus]|nr:hypothetical protein GGF32_002642 [Allomyces javanicus]